MAQSIGKMKKMKTKKSKKRFIVKTKKIPGRGGGPKIDNFIIFDTVENKVYNDCIVEEFAQKLCNDLNIYYEAMDAKKEK